MKNVPVNSIAKHKRMHCSYTFLMISSYGSNLKHSNLVVFTLPKHSLVILCVTHFSCNLWRAMWIQTCWHILCVHTKYAATYKYRSTNKYGSVIWMGAKGFLFRLMLRIISAKCSTSTIVRTTCSVISHYKVSVYCYHWVEEQQVLWSGLLQYVPLFLNGKYSYRVHCAELTAQTHVTKWPYFIFMCCMKVMWEKLSLCLSPSVFDFAPICLSWIKVGIYILPTVTKYRHGWSLAESIYN